MSKDQLGDRMKEYENVFRHVVPKRLPIIIRLDGCHFHTYTKGMERPYDWKLRQAFLETAMLLCKEIQGAKMAYLQSDEISLLLTNNDKLTTQSWFDNSLTKITSVSASLASVYFNEAMKKYYPEREKLMVGGKPLIATFDSRAFIVPPDDVTNYFIWRQQDATRNSLSSAAQFHFTQSELNNMKQPQLQEMLFKHKDINWNDYDTWKKRGACIIRTPKEVSSEKNRRYKYEVDLDIPIFTQDREYIERFI